MNLFETQAAIHLHDGSLTENGITLTERESTGVFSLYIQAKTDIPIHPDEGISVFLKPKMAVTSATAIYKKGEFWCAPHFTDDVSVLPNETQACILRLADGSFLVVLPLVSEEYKCVLSSGEAGSFRAKLFSWYDGLTSCSAPALVYSVAKRPSEAFHACVKEAIRILGTGLLPREDRIYPEAFEYLGWCSWDSMQIRVSHEGLLEKCREFKEKKIPVRWVMIDDMWAEVREFWGASYSDFKEMLALMHQGTLYHFDGDPERFPKGLKGCIDDLHRMGLQVGIWHPTTGYWHGIAPEGKAHDILKDYLIQVKSSRRVSNTEENYLIPSWEEKKSFGYYDTLHRFFRECGADIVKVDNQSMTRRYYKGQAPVGRVAREFHRGMDESVEQNFGPNVINCMGMSSEDMWNRISSPVCRCSNDFLPENRAWFANHVLQCAYGSMLQGELYYCDWDMWWTDDGQALKNSVLRAISGGPVYVSDKIDRSRGEVLAPLCLSDGRILRCTRPAVATYDCATVDPTRSGQALKVQGRYKEYGILAVFNIDEEDRPVSTHIGSEFVDGLDGEEYAIYEHFSGELKVLRKEEAFSLTLSDSEDFKLYILAPVKDGFAAIGRTDKFISPATIRSVDGEAVTLWEDGPYAFVKDGVLHTIKTQE